MLLNVGEEHVQVDIQSLFVGLSKLKVSVIVKFDFKNKRLILSIKYFPIKKKSTSTQT